MRLKLMLAAGVAAMGMGVAGTLPAGAQQAKILASAPGLKADPAIRFGRLPNGMHYLIYKNASPPKSASLRLRFDVGSLHEAEDQRGLAHFIEHMVFNGTTNVPEGEFIKRLERVGLKFGPDTNAQTGFTDTVYMLDLPLGDPATLDTALYLMREAAGEATMTTTAIDSERGIVLSEERARATPQMRIALDQIDYLLGDELLARRLPIGNTEILRTAPRERFVSLYQAYYRPERATLVAVGDFDVAAVEAKIRKQFSDWQGKGAAGPALPPAKLAERGRDARVFVEPGGSTQATVNWVRPADLRPDSLARRQEKVLDALATQVFNRRVERIAATSDNPPFIGGGVSRSTQADRAEFTQLVAVTQAGKWKEGLAAIELEQRRALQFGFTQAELDREITVYRTALNAAAAGAGTRGSGALANGLAAAIDNDAVFTTPADDLAMFDAAVKDLKVERVNTAFKALFTGSGPLLYLTSPTAVEGGAATLTAAYDAALKVPVAASAVKSAAAWPYQSFGTPGQFVDRKEFADLDTTSVRFANGVRLTMRASSQRKDEIYVAARIGSGLRELPLDKPNPAWAINPGGFTSGGLGKITFEDLQESLASKTAGAAFAINEDAFTLQGKTRPEDLATQMQLLAAYVADPAWRAQGWQRMRALAPTIHDGVENTPGGVFSREASPLLHSGDRRWKLPTREEMAGSTIADAKGMLAGPLATGPIEVIAVGDFDPAVMIAEVAKTFGALQRPVNAAIVQGPPVRFPAAALERRTHKGRADQAQAFIAWPTTDFYSDQKRARTLNLLSDIMELRLVEEVREKQGTTYSPNSGHTASEIYPGYGYLSAAIEAPPEKADGFLADAAKIAADLVARLVDADELERARRPRIEGLERTMASSNAWWLGQLPGIVDNPGVATSLRQAVTQYKAITPADIQKVARDYLVDKRAWKMVVTPEKK